jgi:hypothetical protein
MHLRVTLGGERGDGVELHLRKCANHLLSCNVSVRAGGFRAAYVTEIFEDELKDLRDRLVNVIEHVSDRVEFSNELQGLEFSLLMEGTGQATVEGTARDLTHGTRLSFTFFTDQAYLAETISQLRHVLQEIA